MTRLIKRYGNRKLYDTKTSRYVTLDGIADLVRQGEDLKIADNDTGEDLTALCFAQIIFEEEKRKNGLLGLPVLRRIIQQGGATLQEILTSVENVRELAEKRVKQLVQGAEKGRAETPHAEDTRGGRTLLTDIFELPQKQIEQLQQRIDTQVRASLERVAAHPAVQHELQRIQESIKGLERQLSRLRRPPRDMPERPGKRRTPKKRAGE